MPPLEAGLQLEVMEWHPEPEPHDGSWAAQLAWLQGRREHVRRTLLRVREEIVPARESSLLITLPVDGRATPLVIHVYAAAPGRRAPPCPRESQEVAVAALSADGPWETGPHRAPQRRRSQRDALDFMAGAFAAPAGGTLITDLRTALERSQRAK